MNGPKLSVSLTLAMTGTEIASNKRETNPDAH
jgi:hypothetical protein